MIRRLLIANRGEIAVRIARTAHRLGIDTVGVYSTSDADALHVDVVDLAVALGGATPTESYLRAEAVIQAALDTGCDAVHPGYGFLAERADVAHMVVDAGLIWVGPTPEQISLLGDKIAAKRAAVEAGVPTTEAVEVRPGHVPDGLPMPALVKAAAGGGGRGMRIVRSAEQLPEAVVAASREAESAFGDGTVFVEPYIERGRHVEVQIVGDAHGNVIHLGERECSIQRRNQKVLEESPSAGITPETRAALCDGALALARHIGYRSAGTVEFMVGPPTDEHDGTISFLEVNTRLQVEHPVTELVTGVDLVHQQLRIAAGDGMTIAQDDVELRGHAIEVRLNAEDPATNFMPSPGPVTRITVPQGPWIRFDGGVESGDVIGGAYDSMVGKLIVWGEDRATAVSRMARALEEMTVVGVPTTLPFHRLAMAHEDFVTASHATSSVEGDWDLSTLEPWQPADPEPVATNGHAPGHTTTAREVELFVSGAPLHVTVHGVGRANAAVQAASSRRRDGGGRRGAGASNDGPELRAPMTGVIVTYAVADGDTVSAGDIVCVLEAMKMENHVVAHRDGTVGGIGLSDGDAVEQGALLATITA